MKRIILASTSAGRKGLMDKLQIPYEAIGSDFEEDMTLNLSPHELALFLSQGKAKAVAHKHPDAVVIGADTFVVFEDKLLGKPRDNDHAREILSMIRNKKHTLLTGVTIIEGSKIISEVVATDVYVKDVSDEVIHEYVESGESKGRAGAYGIQGKGEQILIDRIEGEYNNIVGLPTDTLAKILEREFGVIIKAL